MAQLIEGNGSLIPVDHVAGVPVVLANSIAFGADVEPGSVVVTGSHGGRSAGEYARRFAFGGLVANDAGHGLNDAGVAGVAALAEIGVPGAAVAHTSARIGDAVDAWENGVISYVNPVAELAGVAIGSSTVDAVTRIASYLAGGSTDVA